MAHFLILILSLLAGAVCITDASTNHHWVTAVGALYFMLLSWRFRQVTSVVPEKLAIIIAIALTSTTTGTLASFLHLLGIL